MTELKVAATEVVQITFGGNNGFNFFDPEKIIEEKNPELPSKAIVGKQVAAGAIKYFDLSHNLKSDIVFDPKKAITFEGNTGPYLMYTHARIHGILRKFNTTPSANAATPPLKGGELEQ